MTRYFEDVDGHDEPTIWRQDGDALPQPVLRRCDLRDRSEWLRIVAALNPAAIWEQGRAAGAALFPAQADENPWGQP